MLREGTGAGRLPCGRERPCADLPARGSRATRLAALEARLDAYTKAQRLNRTSSRARLLAILLDLPPHFTLTDLAAAAAAAGRRIGTATVYRAIPVLLGAGVLRETLVRESGEKLYEVEPAHHHDHIVCLDCDAIFEFHEDRIETLQTAVLSGLDFREVRHRHVVYARCAYGGPRSRTAKRP